MSDDESPPPGEAADGPGDGPTAAGDHGADDGDGESTTAPTPPASPPPVDPDVVRDVAELARVEVDDDEVAAFTEQFADVLAYFETLDEVPEFDREEELSNVMRADEVREGLSKEEALSNAPDREGDYFVGPRVS